MIKNTIIVILLLLLLITFYAYMCLSNNMVDFQKERMEFILSKETELKQKEQKLVSLEECNDNMNKYKNIVGRLSTDLTKSVEDFNDIVKFINQTNTTMNSTKNTTMNSTKNNSENPVTKTSETFTVINNMIENFNNLEENNDELDRPIEDNQ